MDNYPHEDLTKIFERDERITVAYLFGSKARGSHTPESDTDVAVLLSEIPKEMLEYYLDLTDARATWKKRDRIRVSIR